MTFHPRIPSLEPVRTGAVSFFLAAGILGCSLTTGGLGLPSNPTNNSTSASASRTPGPTATPTTIETPTSKAGAFLESFQSYSFPTPWQDLPSGNLVVAWDETANRFDYITWQGETGPLIEVDGDALGPFASPLGILGQGRGVAMIDGFIGDQKRRIDFVDLPEERAWGYEARCAPGESVGDIELGQAYLEYECGQPGTPTPRTFKFVSMDNPGIVLERPLPDGIEKLDPTLEPTWIDPETIYLVGAGRGAARGTTACVASVIDWQPDCLSAPYMFGAVSPDGRWIEVRDGQFPDAWPERVGAIPTDCLRQLSEAVCTPKWVETGFLVGDRITEYPAVWSPDSKSFFLLNRPDVPLIDRSTDVWRFNVDSGSLAQVGSIPNQPDRSFFSLPYGYLRSEVIWSLDGHRLLLLRADCPTCAPPRGPEHYTFDMRDGSLTLLASTQGWATGVIQVP